MRVINPITVNDSVLTSSTIPEPDAAYGEVEWSAGTYNLGQEVIKSSTHRRYRVVADPSTTDDPEVGVDANPATWVDIGATNRYSMFDNKNGTQSFDNTTLDVTITPATLTNSLAGFNITGADAINVTVNDGVSDIYDRDISMRDNSARVDWYYFFFSPVVAITRFVLTDLPPVIAKDITISVTGGGDIGFGNLVLGSYLDLGETAYGSGITGVDYSIRTSDGFGGFDITRRDTADVMEYKCFIDRQKSLYVKNLMKSLSQTETVWIGDETDVNDAMTTFGYYSNYKIGEINSPSKIALNFDVQELI